MAEQCSKALITRMHDGFGSSESITQGGDDFLCSAEAFHSSISSTVTFFASDSSSSSDSSCGSRPYSHTHCLETCEEISTGAGKTRGRMLHDCPANRLQNKKLEHTLLKIVLPQKPKSRRPPPPPQPPPPQQQQQQLQQQRPGENHHNHQLQPRRRLGRRRRPQPQTQSQTQSQLSRIRIHRNSRSGSGSRSSRSS